MLLPHRHRPPPRRGGSHRHRAVRRVAGLATWLAGCLLLLLLFALVVVQAVLYSTSYSARSRCRHEEGSSRQVLARAAPPRITIFSVPWPPPEGSPARQELAVRSWLALPGNVSVVLLGASPTAAALAARLGRRVTVEAAVDSAFTGTPFFHSMVARAQAASDSDICVLVDAEIVLLPEFVSALTRLSKVDRDWFLVAMSRNITNFHYQLVGNGSHWIQKDSEEASFIKGIPADRRVAQSSDRGIIMAWNNPGNPLHAGVLPCFLYGRGVHNSWLANEVLSSEMRLVFDASGLVLGLHPEGFALMHDMSLGKNDSLPVRSWEYSANRHLAAVYGSYCYQLPRRDSTSSLYNMIKYSEGYMLSKVDELTLSNFVTGKEDKVHGEEGNLLRKEDICLSAHDHSYTSETSAPVDLPYSLGILLELVADKNRSVVLGVAGASYRDMLMSWVCRLRHLGVTNFIVCALDHDTYEFSVLQGLPVFRDPLSPKNVSFDDCHFGTNCFQQVTKVKSRIVLEILKLGYNVLLSDVDVYWFHNPMPYLYSLGPATFVAQSDEFNETGLSEQPSFYDVLCGKDGTNRIGDNKCLEPNTNMTVVFLNRDLFPNGAYKDLWNNHDVHSICKELGCFILHNNWINGRKKKLWRQMSSGLWDYDPISRLCLQDWSDKSRFRMFEGVDS
ncbi:hypothetical protein PR202_ga05645 [Eleusine coracana subsp. coracana]|uniref:Nucleotide-diphospho-sugar transferase domain-containing protein n=1 Tax=Eleusine coracana subsp. coracana TaxID=191504 RepID=A0AAV5BUW2_ELECO|nr:hypothetical protein PR202_ga05191 [Eleusine coracana subsp. coracana]GJM89450.1 hypothetical protein PR202_ga05645 [Eleusine coracana subsp. coracana]